LRKEEKFTTLVHCPHVANRSETLDLLQAVIDAFPDSRHPPVNPESKFYQNLLAMASKTQFMTDLDRMKYGNNTSFIENFWSICIRYRPKRKYFRELVLIGSFLNKKFSGRKNMKKSPKFRFFIHPVLLE
jgi:hypothetical protein